MRRHFFEFLMQEAPLGSPSGPSGPGMGGIPGGPPGGGMGMPGGGPPMGGGPMGLGGGPPMGGLGGPGLGGGGLGMGGPGGPGGMPGQQQQPMLPPTNIKTKDVWSILEKLLSGDSKQKLATNV